MEAIESVERVESLYISLAVETSERLEAAEKAIAILKKAVANTSVGTGMSKPKIPKPKAFGGARSSKELENFLWDMEYYFSAAKVGLDEQVNIVVMYLMKDAKLWWRTRSKEDLNAVGQKWRHGRFWNVSWKSNFCTTTHPGLQGKTWKSCGKMGR